jgi:hypothetical protein
MASPDRDSLVWLPALLLAIVAAWGVFTGVPRLTSDRPVERIPQTPAIPEPQNIPARLWQDPLAVAYAAQARVTQDAKDADLAGVLKRERGSARSFDNLVFLTVMLPGDTYPELVEQCRRRRYAVLSALAQAGYVPVRSQHIGFLAVSRTGAEVDAKARPDTGRTRLIVPFEWFEPGHDRPLCANRIFVNWVDESQLGRTPLGHLIDLHSQFQAAARGCPGRS